MKTLSSLKHTTGRMTFRLATAAAIVSVFPAAAAAQACIGSPAMTSQFTIGGYAHFTDGASAYGVASQSNLPNRASMGAHLGLIDLDDADDNLTSAGVNFALDMGRTGISVCPMVAANYDFWSGNFAGIDLDYSRITIPVGVGVGSRLGRAGSPIFIPSGRAGLLHARHSGSAEIAGGVFSRTDTTTDLFLDADATLMLGRLYGTVGIRQVFEDESDPVVRVGLGIVF
jgi:hypothetical protein